MIYRLKLTQDLRGKLCHLINYSKPFWSHQALEVKEGVWVAGLGCYQGAYEQIGSLYRFLRKVNEGVGQISTEALARSETLPGD